MKKIVLLLLLFIPFNVFASDLEILSKSAIVVNRSNNEIIYEKNIDEKLPIASLTKIMTAIVTLENVSSLENKIIVKDSDINNLYGYQVVGLSAGMEVTISDLIYSTMMYSAGDSAMVLANNIFDDYDIFIDKMNELADKIGMKNTKLSNPVGFDNNNYSTSYDMFLLLDYALDNENFYDLFTKKSYKMKSLDKSIYNDVNTIIKDLNIKSNNIKFDGYKGGYTSVSGLSLSGLVNIDDNDLIIITIGASGESNSHNNIIDSLKILSNIKDNYSNRVILEKNKLIDNIIYKDGNNEINYEIRSYKNIKYYMNKTLNLNYLKIYYEGKTVLDNSIENGDEIGKIYIYHGERLLGSEVIRFDKKYVIKESKNYKNLLIFIGICLVGLVVFKKKK